MADFSDDGDAGKGAEHDALGARNVDSSQKYKEVKPLYFLGAWRQQEGIHLYIQYQASW